MQQIVQGIYYDDSYLGVIVGEIIYSYGIVSIYSPIRSEDVRSWRSAMNDYRGGPNRLLISLDAQPDRTLGTRAL